MHDLTTRMDDAATDRPTVFAFAISHYCERAIWGLKAHGIAHRVRNLAPGAHVLQARRAGASETSVPLVIGRQGELVQGSDRILDWAQEQSPIAGPDWRLDDTARALEAELETAIGPTLRRMYYADALREQPGDVRQAFQTGMTLADRAALNVAWPGLRQAMKRGFALDRNGFVAHRLRMERALDMLDARLAKGEGYLTGDRFGRIDLTVASLLAPMVQPAQHPVYAKLALPSRLAKAVAGWRDRPVMGWVREVYARHR